jgi:hypothetical protein
MIYEDLSKVMLNWVNGSYMRVECGYFVNHNRGVE